MEAQPWPKIKEELVYKGYRKILRVTFKSPEGQETDFDVVDEKRVVCILPLTADNHIILAKQFRPGPENILLELPGGGIKEGEEPAMAAARELLEETGYRGNLQFVCKSLQSAYSNMTRYNFVATGCEKIAETSNDEGEFTEPILMSLDDFREHIRNGQLTDMGTGYRGLDYLKLL